MICAPFLVDCRIDQILNTKCTPDTGCNTQSLVDFSFVRPNKLERIPIVPREIKAYDDRPGEKVQAVVKYEIDIGAHNHAEIRGGGSAEHSSCTVPATDTVKSPFCHRNARNRH